MPETINRRQFARTLGVFLPATRLLAAPDSRIGGVQIGVMSYSFREIPGDQILPSCLKLGISELELMSFHAEVLLGAPGSNDGGALDKWRASVNTNDFARLRQTFQNAGVEIRLLYADLPKTADDAGIDYVFRVAKALGVRAISSSSPIPVAKRVAPIAAKYGIPWGSHGHDNTGDPDEFSSPETFATALALSPLNGVNLDIGHFTAAGFDAVAFIQQHHARITNLHLKDRKKKHGPNVPWGEGDTPIRDVLQLLKREKWDIPANIEYEYPGKADPVTEVGHCLDYCREALA